MKSNSEHQKKATTTDQKFRVQDEHLREVDKRHLKESKEDKELIPEGKKPEAETDGD